MTSSHTSSTSVSSEWWRPTRPMNWGQLFGKLEKTWPLMTRWASFSDGSPKSSSSWSFPHAFMATLGARHVNPPSWRVYIYNYIVRRYRLDTFFCWWQRVIYPMEFLITVPVQPFFPVPAVASGRRLTPGMKGLPSTLATSSLWLEMGTRGKPLETSTLPMSCLERGRWWELGNRFHDLGDLVNRSSNSPILGQTKCNASFELWNWVPTWTELIYIWLSEG